MASVKKLVQIQILYPNEGRDTAKPDYYANVHMPLAMKLWSSKGMLSWSVVDLPPESGFCMQGTMFFESMEAWKEASKDGLPAELLEDFNKYWFVPEAKRTWLVGEVRATSS